MNSQLMKLTLLFGMVMLMINSSHAQTMNVDDHIANLTEGHHLS